MLLTDLLKHTSEDHIDYESLKKALDSFAELAKIINTSKGVSDNINKVYQIQEKLGLEDLVQPSRVYVKDGILNQEKKAEKVLKGTLRATVSNFWSKVGYNHTSVRAYLFNDLLIITNAGEAYFSRDTVHLLELKDAIIDPIEVAKNKGFCLTMNKGKALEDILLLYGENETETNQWFDHISKCITEIKHNFKTLRIDSRIKMPRIGGTLEPLPPNPTSQTHSPTIPPKSPELSAPDKPTSNPTAFGIKLTGLADKKPSQNPESHSSLDIQTGSTSANLSSYQSVSLPLKSGYGTIPRNTSPAKDPYAIPKASPYSYSPADLPSSTQVVTNVEVGEALKRYKKIFELEKQIFDTLPQIKQLIKNYPQLESSMPTLNEIVGAITNEHSQVLKLLKNERKFVTLTSEIYKGQDHLKNLSTTVGMVFPKDSTIPGSKEIRSWTAYLMQWYFSLVELLDEIEKQKP